METTTPTHQALYEKLAILVATTAVAMTVFAICVGLEVAPTYSDFIVGKITWTASTKLQDLVIAPALMVVMCLLPLLLGSQLNELRARGGPAASSRLAEQLIVWSLPSVALLFSLLLHSKPDLWVVSIPVFGLGFIVASLFLNKAPSSLDARQLGYAAFSFILIGLFPLEVALALGRWNSASISAEAFPRFLHATYILIAFGAVIGGYLAATYPQKLIGLLRRLMLLGQIGLPLFFLMLFPAKLVTPNMELINYDTTIWLKLLIGILISYGVIDVVRRYYKYSAGEDIANMLSPVAIFALLVGLKLGRTRAPIINAEDYHFGESLLGWWSYLQGTVPYVGYTPVHGLIDDDLVGIICKIFYDGTAGGMSDAARLAYALLGLGAFLSIHAFTRSMKLAFASTFFLGGRLVWFFLTPFFCLLCSSSLRERPSHWLALWILCIPIVILGTPAQGVLFVIASSFIAAHSLWQLWRAPELFNWKPIAIAILLLAVHAVLTPVVGMLLGAIRYVLENGPINQLAYGVAWRQSWGKGDSSGLVFELIRNSWVFVPVICVAVFYSQAKSNKRWIHNLPPVAFVAAFILLLIPYSMGRIDPGDISRSGFVAIFAWTVLLPVAVWPLISPNTKTGLVLLVVCAGSALGFVNLSIQRFVAATAATIDTQPLLDGSSAGLPGLGKATVQVEHWNRLTALKALLEKYLAPGQPYLDLTSRHAQYFYLGRKPVIDVTAPNNIVPLLQQKRAVERLSASPPAIALLESDNVAIDGVRLGLRAPYLYRYVVDNFVPHVENGFIIGSHKMLWKNGAGENLPDATIEVPIQNTTDGDWISGIHRSAAALVLEDPVLLSVLEPGDVVDLQEYGIRTVNKVSPEGSAIWFDGNALDASRVNSGYVHISLSDELLAEYRSALFQAAFSQQELGEIPVAWGRSVKSLSSRMHQVYDFGGLKPELFHLLSIGNDLFKITGRDPSISFDLSQLRLSGREAGLLRFDFACEGANNSPRLQVFWWGDHRASPKATSSVNFTAVDGTLIVPLDSSANWLTLNHIKVVRIDLSNPSSCTAISVRNIGLYQRRFP